jgi:hypothetical protein
VFPPVSGSFVLRSHWVGDGATELGVEVLAKSEDEDGARIVRAGETEVGWKEGRDET